MQPPYSSHSTPDPLALIAPAPPHTPNSRLFFGILGQSLVYSLAGGAGLGSIYGALLGTLIVPVIGTIFGLYIGAIIGTIFGSLAGIFGGAVLGSLTLLYFVPLGSARFYRWYIGLIGALITAMLGLLAVQLYAPKSTIPLGVIPALTSATGLFGVIPALIAVGYAWWVTGQLADWYARSAVSQAMLPRHAQPAQIARDIYHPDFLQQLFDEMQGTYELVCYITSFGFNRRWRAQLLQLLDLRPGMRVCDAMCGTGEVWRHILPRIGPTGSLAAVDFSCAMARQARQRRRGLAGRAIEVLEEDTLQMSLPSASIDALICAYGVKTLSDADQKRFVCEIKRVLKIGGSFGLVEVSAPHGRLLRPMYLFYLRYIVPLIGCLLLGNPQNYRMLSRYVTEFGNSKRLRELFADAGFAVHEYAFFGSCATALVGMKLDEC